MPNAATLTAMRADTQVQIAIGDLPLETLRALSDGRLLRCPGCGEALTLKAGPVRLHHFAHAAGCSAPYHEPETEAHRLGKWRLFSHFRAGAQAAMMEQHIPESNQRADVCITRPEGRYALEFQQANNTVEGWNARHVGYRQAGLFDVWFLGQVRLHVAQGERLHPISPYDPPPVPRTEFEAAAGAFRVRELERAMLDSVSNAPALYFLDPESGIVTLLLAREMRGQTLRAYRYCFPLESCALQDGRLWTPVDPLLGAYWAWQAGRSRPPRV